MTKGIYFIDKNSSFLSDIESFFVVNDMVCFRGGTGLLQQALKDLGDRKDIDIIVISDNLVDATCVEALKALLKHPEKKIVALRSRDEVARERISKHAVVISYPYSCNVLEETIKRMADATEYDETDLERIADSNVESDNPFSAAPQVAKLTKEEQHEKKSSFQDRLKSIQLSKNTRKENRLIPQKVIAIHSQKGGVGKSTISRELAIGMHCVRIKKESVEYAPKVCLCDFDFEAADITVIMDLDEAPNIMTWCEDIEYEANRTGEKHSGIRFTENVIKERYLQEHESGVYVLTAPSRKIDCFKIENAYVEAIIQNLRLCDFDVIILDTGPNILDYTLTTLSLADEIFAVCNCDMLSAKRIDGMTGDVLSKMKGFDFNKMKLLVNHMAEKSSVSPEELSAALNLSLVGEIPYFPGVVNINNEGVSVFFNRKKMNGRAVDYADAFRMIARKLICTEINEEKRENRGYSVEGLDAVRKKANFSIFRR
ncbi:MAG TPA: hypothetical protein DEB10_12940 [Ruminococcaceae bacterium]|nr:hypothetical protein [Oscillospiraceae bacterium]